MVVHLSETIAIDCNQLMYILIKVW